MGRVHAKAKPTVRSVRKAAKRAPKRVAITEDEADVLISERRMTRDGRLIPLEEGLRRLHELDR